MNIAQSTPLSVFLDANALINKNSAFHLLDFIYKNRAEKPNTNFYIFGSVLGEVKKWYLLNEHCYNFSHIEAFRPDIYRILQLIENGTIQEMELSEEEKHTHVDAVILGRIHVHRHHAPILVITGDKDLQSDILDINNTRCSKSKFEINVTDLNKPLPYSNATYLQEVLCNDLAWN